MKRDERLREAIQARLGGPGTNSTEREFLRSLLAILDGEPARPEPTR